MRTIIAFLLLCGLSLAQESSSERVLRMENELLRVRLALLESERGGDPNTSVPHGAGGNDADRRKDTPSVPATGTEPGSAAAPTTAPPASDSRTTVCQCRGYNETVCLCLKNGQKCHCSRDVGSVWSVNDAGVATHKTGAKADPDAADRITPAAPPPPAEPETGGYAVTINGAWMYWTDSRGQRWDNRGYGTGYSTYGQFEYRNGRMFERGQAPTSNRITLPVPSSKPLINTQGTRSRSGHWETQCFGSYCQRVWVPD